MKLLRKYISLGTMLILSFVVVNILVFFYERPVSWLDTPNGASPSIRKPGSILIHGNEGYGISQIDRNGYINPNLPLDDTYILMMGTSHTQGKEVKEDMKYSVLVNNEIADDHERLKTYNIASDGNVLPSVIKHFKSATALYQDADCVTIEINSTDYSAEDINTAVEQNRVMETDMSTADQLFAQSGLTYRMKQFFKIYLPLLPLINSHIETARINKTTVGEYSVDALEYENALQTALNLIRSEYDEPIVFIYHPETQIQSDGTIFIKRSKTIDSFKKTCMDSDIDFIDVGDDFVSYYERYQELPYGFSNTTPGSGHLNKIGHRIVADAILKYLEEINY